MLLLFLKNWPTPASSSFIFGHFKQTVQFFQQINVQNWSSSIRHQDSNPQPFKMSCHPEALDQGSRPNDVSLHTKRSFIPTSSQRSKYMFNGRFDPITCCLSFVLLSKGLHERANKRERRIRGKCSKMFRQ